MFYRDFTEEQMSKIISLIIGGEKFRAISEYRNLDKDSSSENVIARVIEVAGKISEWIKNPEFALKHKPSVCCINCVGMCGRWKLKMANGGFDSSSCKFDGVGCPHFVGAEDFKKEKNDYQFTFYKKNAGENVQELVKIKVEDKISSITHELYNTRQRKILKSKKRIMIVDNQEMLGHVIKLIRKGFAIQESMPVPLTMTIGNKAPKENEKSYREYFSRCQAEIREENKKIENKVYKMSYEEACAEFLKMASASEKSIISSLGGDVRAYLRDFYNGQSVWQILEQLKKA